MKSILSLVAICCFSIMLQAQEATSAPTPAATRYALETVLVLTPELCKTEWKLQGNWFSASEKFKFGELICPAAEAVAQQSFEKYTKAAAPPPVADAPGKITLQLRFVSADVTKTATAFGKRKMVLLVEWTATDAAGKAFWTQTITASDEEASGNTFTYKKHRKKLLEKVKNDLIKQSVAALGTSPELRKLAQKSTGVS